METLRHTGYLSCFLHYSQYVPTPSGLELHKCQVLYGTHYISTEAQPPDLGNSLEQRESLLKEVRALLIVTKMIF